ncbi:PilZ domain-containing protein [Psychromonas ossibalaenae]|uniref:PilZ domain-containing protein n=1 Tax=Psychromonas ossibalaenae TaxID=444922 RepID=UPI000362CBA0|nr:PilZ domain-containing protein [Psychromonas ossibalaenae]
MLTAHDDRREFRRMAIETSVKILKGTFELQGVCKDLSSTGMSIQLTDLSLRAGDEIEVQLGTDDLRFPPLNAQAKVLRINEQGDVFIAAIEFTVIK